MEFHLEFHVDADLQWDNFSGIFALVFQTGNCNPGNYLLDVWPDEKGIEMTVYKITYISGDGETDWVICREFSYDGNYLLTKHQSPFETRMVSNLLSCQKILSVEPIEMQI